MATPNLLTPGRIDGFETRNRLMMAPMTRSRALAGGVPSDLAIEYYAQRASAGIIVTEGVAPTAVGLGYARTPAIESREQIAVWKKITAAVKARLSTGLGLSALGDISVDSTDGLVTLSGSVASREDINKAVKIAAETEGVRQVISTLQVKPVK